MSAEDRPGPSPQGQRIRFPDDFLWGAATSAYQIEGSPLADGAGTSIWHRFSHSPGRTHEGQTGDVACEHYRRYAEDVEIMSELGLQAYRFSLSWGRILPTGRGEVNDAGLGFYHRLIDALLEKGIQPCPTLYHWDLPDALSDVGGWLNRDIADWFGEYARVVLRAFGDRVPMWMTINEPWVVADAGYLHGVHAPGHSSPFEAPLATHNLLRAHGRAVEVCRSEAHGKIGLVVNLGPQHPATDSPEDVAAAGRADAYLNRQYLDPIFEGRYPEEMHEIFGEAWPESPQEDFRLIQEPMDFLAVNYYSRLVVRHDEKAPPVRASPVHQSGSRYTEMGWEVYPRGLTETLCRLMEQYGDIPIYITENGAAIDDPSKVEGDLVDDPERVDYLHQHLRAAHEALRRGVDLRGYFVWSLLDNFEWSLGYSKRFGLIHVDYETQKRTPKSSAHFYRDVIRSRGELLQAPPPRGA